MADSVVSVTPQTNQNEAADEPHQSEDKTSTEKTNDGIEQANKTEVPDDDVPSKTNELYDRILKETKTRVFIMMLLALSDPLMSSSRYPFLFLFIQSFDDSITTAQVSAMIFAAAMMRSITNTTIVPLGDRKGHDKVYGFCRLIALIGLSIEAVSTSFGAFFVGHICNRVPNREIAFAYLASVLPHKFATKYCGLLYTLISVLYLLAPVIGALIAQFINYRAIFIFNAALHFILVFVSFFLLNGSIKYLEHKHQLCGIIDGLHEDEQFPICLRNAKKKSEKSETPLPETEPKKSDDANILIEYISFWRSLPVYDLWMLLCSIFINNLMWADEAVLLYFFVLFLTSVYGASPLYGAFMLVQIVVIFGVITLIVPRMIRRVIPSNLWLMAILLILLTFVFVLCTFNNILEMHWVYGVGVAVPFGIVTMMSEMCVLELQPKEHSGKVVGLNSGLRNVVCAVSLLLIGLFWTEPYNALWFGMAAISMMACLLSIVMMVMVQCKKEQEAPKQSTNDEVDVKVVDPQ